MKTNNSLSLNYGIGVFETIRLINEKMEYIKEHIDRLLKGLDVIGINSYSFDEIFNMLDEFIKFNKHSNGIIKIIVNYEGEVITYRENIYKKEDYEIGFKLTKSNIVMPKQNKFTIKSTNYLINYLELINAKDNGFDEILFLNCDKKVVEGSKSNIFIIKDNKIMTPSLESGCLSGIMRNVIIEKSGYKINETDIELLDILTADAVFITNSIIGVMPISKFGKKNRYSIDNDIMRDLIKKFCK